MASAEWLSVYGKIEEVLAARGKNTILFRGHSDASWRLLPSLARATPRIEHDLSVYERVIFFDFVTRAGDLLSAGSDSWAAAFAMQHHGLPTRLLDWTESFAVALYFALRAGTGDATIWVLDPYTLNASTCARDELFHPHEVGLYDELFIERTKSLTGAAVAISPLRHNPRVFRQRSGFTLHGDLGTPLDAVCPNALIRIDIPSTARTSGQLFLEMAGMSEFSLFPDLDGLAKDLKHEYFVE